LSTLLVTGAALLVTMDAGRREIADGAVFARDGVIEAVGTSAELPAAADEVIDARGQIVAPGLVNTHHHMYQTLTRGAAAGAGQRALRLAERAVPDLGTPPWWPASKTSACIPTCATTSSRPSCWADAAAGSSPPGGGPPSARMLD
jgi:hypothetical protein